MSMGIRCWNEHGYLTFDGLQRTILQQHVVYIASGSQGSIGLWELPNGLNGVVFQAVSGVNNGIEPYTWVANNRLYWRGSEGAYYLTVIGATG